MPWLKGTWLLLYSRFRHMFKRHTGLSPKAYMVELRIDKARNITRASMDAHICCLLRERVV